MRPDGLDSAMIAKYDAREWRMRAWRPLWLDPTTIVIYGPQNSAVLLTLRLLRFSAQSEQEKCLST